MQDLILSRIDYTLLAIFVFVLLLVVVLVISRPSPETRTEHPIRQLALSAKQHTAEHIVEYGFLGALLAFFVILTLVSRPNQQASYASEAEK
jgi:Na+/H+ antiporter NhaD/arsenite permease-like protein